jgi:hypothetical protein
VPTDEHDTDPSTPEARRSTEGRSGAPFGDDPPPSPEGVSERPPVPRISTDPGVGPPSEVRVPTPRPMGIVVPVAAPFAKKDSVEILLDGITGLQPERTKTTPQTDGQASAAYHARHDVRPARTSPDAEPKVVVERAQHAPTLRIDRAKLNAARSLDPTAVVPAQVGPRIVAAVVSGLVVVLLLFVATRLTFPQTPAASASPSLAPAPLASEIPAVPSARASQAPPAAETAAPSNNVVEKRAVPAPPLVSPAAVTAPRPRARPAPPASSSPDWGELKTTFH